MPISRIGTDGIDQTSSQQIGGISVGRGGGAVSTNTAVGASALASNTTGASNAAVGYEAMYANTTGNYNVAFGRDCLDTNTTGSNNTAIGYSALQANTTASYNTALGYQAGYNNTTGTQNFFGGYQAGYGNTTGSGNTAIGYSAGGGLTTTDSNTAVGNNALTGSDSGGSGGNAAFGGDAMRFTTSGSNNTAIGRSALRSNTTASYNTAVGYQAGYSGTTDYGNTFLGTQSGYSFNKATAGSYTNNTFVGISSGYYITTGQKNTILGAYNGNQGGLDIRTSSNYIVLSDGDGNPRAFWNGTGDFYNGATNGTSWTTQTTGGVALVNMGYYYTRNPAATSNRYWYAGMDSASTYILYNNNSTGVYLTHGATSWAGSSDERLKDIIEPIENAAEKVSTLRSVIGKYKTDEEGTRRSFLIAQDVQAVLPEAVSTYKVDGEEDEYLGIAYTDVIPLLVAAIKELKAEFDAYKEAHP